MAVTVAEKAKVIAEHQRAKGDTGSPEVQIALLTARINGLNDHCCGWFRAGASSSITSSRAIPTAIDR